MRIAIVNDMLSAVESLRRILLSVPGYQLAWVAGDGEEAVKKCIEDPPDLILMDLIMPLMDGIEATRRIMASQPCPILIVTATVEGNSSKVFEALGAGALDVVGTRVMGVGGEMAGVGQLKYKIATIERMKSVSEKQYPGQNGGKETLPISRKTEKLVVMGASAGGPVALATVLGGLPRNFSATVVIVQHVDVHFAAPMVDWLNQRSAVPVRVINEGDQVKEGSAFVAATVDHLILRKSRTLAYTPEPRESFYRPSVDVFFESVAQQWKGNIVGVLLTGMGGDGAKGLKALRDSGAHTIAQDRHSCAVYGMPKAAAELGAAIEILPLDQIGPRLTTVLADKPQ